MNIKGYLNKNTNILFILSMLGALVIIIFVSTTWFLPNDSEPTETEWRCLGEDEVASYEKNKKENEVSTATIFVKDKETGEEKYNFEIKLPLPNHYHPIELHKCGVYATRDFGYDYIKRETLDNYSFEFWQYDYSGVGKKIIFLSGPISGQGFGSDFRVSPSEQYVVLERGYGGSDDYALIIKDLNIIEDVFIIPAQEMFKRNPNTTGTLGFIEWTKDSRYFWGDIFMGAYTSGYFRIDMENKTYELFEALEGQMGGDQLNTETGWVTNHSGLFWTGIHEFTEQLKEEMREDGVGTKLYIYNLFTKEKILIYETNEPGWYTKPWWISDTELRYETFEGETRIYKLNSE